MWTVYIGSHVACFLLNTSRVLQATELCQECLILLNTTAKEKVVELAYMDIYVLLCTAYFLLNDHTSAIECGKKLLGFLHRLGLRAEEGQATSRQAQLYQVQSKFTDAIGLYKRAISIMIETGDNKGEALCYRNLSIVYLSLDEYGKAKEYQKKALAIKKEIGDKQGEAMCYRILGIVSQSLGEYEKAEVISKQSTCDSKRNWRQTSGSRVLWKPWKCVSLSR